MSEVIICGPRYIEERVEEQDCPICKDKQRFLLRLEEWHGYTEVCLNCGSVWLESGEWLMPQSKKHRIEQLPYYIEIAEKLDHHA